MSGYGDSERAAVHDARWTRNRKRLAVLQNMGLDECRATLVKKHVCSAAWYNKSDNIKAIILLPKPLDWDQGIRSIQPPRPLVNVPLAVSKRVECYKGKNFLRQVLRHVNVTLSIKYSETRDVGATVCIDC